MNVMKYMAMVVLLLGISGVASAQQCIPRDEICAALECTGAVTAASAVTGCTWREINGGIRAAYEDKCYPTYPGGPRVWCGSYCPDGEVVLTNVQLDELGEPIPVQ